MYNVGFPEFNLFFNINPIAFSLGDINIYWYGILIAISVILGLGLAKLRDGKYGINFDDAEEFVLWALPVGVVCARLYYVIFSWETYKDNPLSILEVWNGGLAIYGGIIGAFLTAVVFCKIKKISFWDLVDYVVPFLALGQAIGRWGNFINIEAYGIPTDSFFRMEILQKSGDYILVHPTFLYESFGLIVIFIVLMLMRRKFSSQNAMVYFLLYGILRALVEWLRADSLMIGNIKVSMLLSILLAISSAVYIIYKSINSGKKSE